MWLYPTAICTQHPGMLQQHERQGKAPRTRQLCSCRCTEHHSAARTLGQAVLQESSTQAQLKLKQPGLACVTVFSFSAATMRGCGCGSNTIFTLLSAAAGQERCGLGCCIKQRRWAVGWVAAGSRAELGSVLRCPDVSSAATPQVRWAPSEAPQPSMCTCVVAVVGAVPQLAVLRAASGPHLAGHRTGAGEAVTACCAEVQPPWHNSSCKKLPLKSCCASSREGRASESVPLRERAPRRTACAGQGHSPCRRRARR